MRRWLLIALAALAAASAQELPLLGITHVAVRVADLAKAHDFYTRVLGFDQAFVFDDAGSTTVAFLKINDRQYIELYPGPAGKAPGWLMHVCFETPDVETVRRLLLDRGLLPSKISKGRAGNLLCSLRDPDGQTVEFLQYLPGSMHCRMDGKALSPRRLSTRLLRVAVAAKDLDASRAFYRDKLGLIEVTPGGSELRVPGPRGDSIELVTGGAPPRICLQAPGRQRDLVDPDGGRIELTAPRAPSARPDKP
jgi:catechol 2,3-dioxygenase-like lactoylglutathione lyase family enzyme